MTLPSNPSDLLDRYTRLRTVQRGLNSALLERIRHEDVREAGDRLGLLRDRSLDALSTIELAVLVDYCLYHQREGGRTLLDRFRSESRPDPSSDEWVVLDAMINSHYALFSVRETIPEFGVRGFDILRREDIRLVDLNLSRTAQPGLIIATQVMEPEGIAMSTGALLPVTPDALDGIIAWSEEFDASGAEKNPARLSAEEEDRLTAGIIRACLSGGSSGQVQYNEAQPGRAGEAGRPGEAERPLEADREDGPDSSSPDP